MYVRINHLSTGIVDSSGVRVFYTDQPPKENVGVLIFGHSVAGHMIIPPRVERYTVKAFCSQKCTDKVSVLVICKSLHIQMHMYITILHVFIIKYAC